MARPPNADSAVTYDTIRDAALALLEADGVRGVAVRGVARQAGVGVGTVRYYFASTDAMLEACLDGYHAQLIALEDRMLAVIRSSPTPQAAVTDGIRAAYELLAARPALVRLRLLLSSRSGGLAKPRRTRERRSFLDKTSALLSELVGKPVDDVRLIVDSLVRVIGSYAACSDAEASDITREADPATARARLHDHTIAMCQALLFPTR